MTQIWVPILRISLVVVFAVLGYAKLTSQYVEGLHDQLRTDFINVWTPVWKTHVFSHTGLASVDSRSFREAVGIFELVCAALLAVGPLKRLSALFMTALMSAAAFTYAQAGQDFYIPAALAVLSFVLNIVPTPPKVKVVRQAPKKKD